MVVDEKFAGLLTQVLSEAEWSVAEACREADIPRSALEGARLGNRVLSVKYINRLIVALMERGKGPAALMLMKPFLPEGYLIRFPGLRNNLHTWRDESAALSLLNEEMVASLEDGRLDEYELDTIERAAHISMGMVLDQVASAREEIRKDRSERRNAPRIAGAPLKVETLVA